MKNRVREWHKV